MSRMPISCAQRIYNNFITTTKSETGSGFGFLVYLTGSKGSFKSPSSSGVGVGAEVGVGVGVDVGVGVAVGVGVTSGPKNTSGSARYCFNLNKSC